MMDVFKRSLCRGALRLGLKQNSLLISWQVILPSELCSGLGYALVLRGEFSSVTGICLVFLFFS